MTEFQIEKVRFNDQGLVPVIVQDAHNGLVLMHAWMNQASLEETLSTKRMCYWSRSRQEFWRKGDTSGHIQTLHRLYIDCDDDTLLAQITQSGAACHTGTRSCFFSEISEDKKITTVEHPQLPESS